MGWRAWVLTSNRKQVGARHALGLQAEAPGGAKVVQQREPRNPVRQRNTLVLQAAAFTGLLETAVDAEAARRARGQPSMCQAVAVFRTPPVSADDIRDELTALLKAFLQARPAVGARPLDAQGWPLGLAAILAQGAALHAQADCNPKLLAKVRSGKPVDLRMAAAALQFFQWVLQRQDLTLDSLGAVESQQLKAVRDTSATLRRVRQDLPASVFSGFEHRAVEAASETTVMQRPQYTYSDLRVLRDERGVWRLHLRRSARFELLRLVPWPGLLRPQMVAEWYEAQRLPAARLRLRLLEADGRVLEEAHPVVRRHLSIDRGLVFDLSDETLAGLQRLLHLPPCTEPLPRLEVIWEVDKVLNLADRDVIVSYRPQDGLSIHFDRAAYPDFDVSVGDSPGLQATPEGWRLDRTLMPREVLAVRLRHRALTDAHGWQLSPAGEWHQDMPEPGR